MKKLILFGFIILAYNSIAFAQQDSSSTAPKYELVKYYFVELKHGPNRNQTDSTEIANIQAGHLANINKMSEEGYLLIAGPFGDDKGGGIFILRVDSYEEAKALCDKDPAIIAGRLIADIRPWYTIKGAFTAEEKIINKP